jgi:hypothetical protein
LWAGLRGGAAAAAGLTAPHVLPLAVATAAWCGWRLRRDARPFAAALVGLAAVMVPWQLHCLYAQGYVNPLVYKPDGYAFQSSGYAEWYRTWGVTSEDTRVAMFHLDRFAQLPDRAFRSPEERAELTELVRPYGRYPFEMSAEVNERFRQSALGRRAESPFFVGVVVPLERAVVVCFDTDDVGFVGRAQLRYLQPSAAVGFVREYGAVKAANQFVKSVTSAVVLTVHVRLVLCRGYHLRCAMAKSAFAWVVAIWVVSYVVGSTLFVAPETRRTITLLPMLVFMLFYAAPGSRTESTV